MSTGSYIKLTKKALSFGWRFTFTKLYNMGLRHEEITIDFTAKIKPGPYYNTCFEIFFLAIVRYVTGIFVLSKCDSDIFTWHGIIAI